MGTGKSGTLIDETGKTHGNLYVIGRSNSKTKSGGVRWICECKICGRQEIVNGRKLRGGRKISCAMCATGHSNNIGGEEFVPHAWRYTVPSLKSAFETPHTIEGDQEFLDIVAAQQSLKAPWPQRIREEIYKYRPSIYEAIERLLLRSHH